MEKELKILSESLDQKVLVLNALLQHSKQQEQLLTGENPDFETFDQLVEKKDQMIDVITRLDDGFEAMYAKLSDGLKGNKDKYAIQIADLKSKIEKVTTLSVQIQEQESKNKQKMDDFFAGRRTQIKSNRQNSKMAYDYYKSMSSIGAVRTSFMDSKQYRD